MSTKKKLFEEDDDIQVKIEGVLRAYPGSTADYIRQQTGLRSCTVYRVLRSLVKFDMAYAIKSDKYIKTKSGGRATHLWYLKEE